MLTALIMNLWQILSAFFIMTAGLFCIGFALLLCQRYILYHIIPISYQYACQVHSCLDKRETVLIRVPVTQQYLILDVSQLNQQQSLTIITKMLARSKPHGINLKALKKGIDIKIQAILTYLLNQENPSAPTPPPAIGSQVVVDEQIKNRQSLNTDVGSEFNARGKQELLDMMAMEVINKQKISLAQYLSQQRRDTDANDKEQQVDADVNLTPVKKERGEDVEKSSKSSSEQSASKKQIEANANLKIFGAPLSESFNVNSSINEPNIFTIKIDQIDITKHHSNNNTSRSIRSRRNKQNRGLETPSGSVSREKSRINLRKTPNKTPYSNHYSAAKRLYEYFTGCDRPSKPICPSTVNQMREQIQKLYQHTRKQGQDNNARARLLKRVEGIKLKTNQFLATK